MPPLVIHLYIIIETFQNHKIMSTKVVLFSSDVYNRDELQNMSPTDLVALAEETKMLGDPDAEISTPAEFQQHFNAGDVDPNHTYIFFVTD